MSADALRDAHRIASQYSEDLADRLEHWRYEHAAAIGCRDLEEGLTVINALIPAIVRLEWTRRLAVWSGRRDGDDRSERQSRRSLRRLLRPLLPIAVLIRWFEQEGFRVSAADFFRTNLDHVKELVRSSVNSAPPDDSIRPVCFDEEGRVFEMSGQPINTPGLEPASVQAALADVSAGRVRSLKDFIAEQVE
jgi:hypothetical protein